MQTLRGMWPCNITGESMQIRVDAVEVSGWMT